MIFGTLGDNLCVARGLQMLLFDPGVHFTQQVLSTKVFSRSQHNLTCSTRSALPASDAATHYLLQFAPEYESNLQILAAL